MRVVDKEDQEVPQGEVGEIVIRGPNVMKGYWHRPEETAEAIRDGWFHTGDLARVDDDGYFYIVDRKKDLIIRGGLNVYPREIEELLYWHPAVAEAAVIGVPHPALGQEVGAAVTLEPGAAIAAEALREHVKALVAAYNYPRHPWIAEELPKAPSGKILKRETSSRKTRARGEAAAACSPGRRQEQAGRAAGGRVRTCPIEPDAQQTAREHRRDRPGRPSGPAPSRPARARGQLRLHRFVATVELWPADGGARLVVTGQGTFGGGREEPGGREHGTGEQLDALGRQLGRG